jgi:hypothetical protein
MKQQLASSFDVILSAHHPDRLSAYSVSGFLTVPGDQASLGKFTQLLPHFIGLNQRAHPFEDFQGLGQIFPSLLRIS